MEDPLRALQKAIASISLASSAQRRNIQVPDSMEVDSHPSAEEDSLPVEFISTTSAAKVLTDYWRENGHPSQPRDRDPMDYDFDLKDFKPGPGDIIVDDAGKETIIVVSKSHVAPTKIPKCCEKAQWIEKLEMLPRRAEHENTSPWTLSRFL